MERTNKCRMDSDVVWRKALAWSVPWNERKKLKTQLLLKWWTTPLYPLKHFKKKKNKERKGVQFRGKAIWGGIGEKVVYSDLVYSKERLCACIQQSVFSWVQHKKKFPMGDLLSFLMSVWQLKLPGSDPVCFLGHELESVWMRQKD